MRKKIPELFGFSIAMLLAVLIAALPATLIAKPKKKEEVAPPPTAVQEIPHIGPQIQGPAITEIPVKVSCIPHQNLPILVQGAKLKLVFYSVPENKGVIKLIYARDDGMMLVVMLNKDHACLVFDMADAHAEDGTFFKRLGPSEKG